MKTRDKIIQASLKLFNEKGERVITTNHIAAHLGMSPGNLYYYFRNKEDIIKSIFDEYITYVRESFVPVSSETPAEVYLQRYCEEVFGSIWRFRFFHASMPEIVMRDKSLHRDYLQAHDILVARARESVLNLRRDGFIIIDDSQIDELIELMRVVGGFWVSYLMANSVSKSITKADVNRGVGKFIVLLWPYSTDKGKVVLTKLKLKYQSPT
ncbi:MULTISPECIES: TetR/AcrR family transcriptional regulator [Vibrio]|uniref:TetR/AcrR family transcriptional regulator n=1 Tax=Vibrio mediterranei TaxID=689 RepID=A0A3G4VHG0_9VIBR|nr:MULTISPECIES: TetR/AcrR family transcriptional regulator [Vibrio]AYV23629.1 TetR/AcrR family transcriptional regulator [Vibrio mediterranei]USE02478.1 TetR/AcrR family transcriptional regulator [Vibrio sp. SCSIO 43133]